MSNGGDVIAAATEKPAAAVAVQYDTITTMADLQRWIGELEQATAFAFDTETDALDYMQANIVGVSFALSGGRAAYVPMAHDYLGAPEQLSREAVLAALKPLLESPAHRKVMQHGKYDMNVLARAGIALQGLTYDTMLESYVLDSVSTRHNMDDLAKKYLDYTTVSFEDIAGKGANQLTFNQVELEKAAFYAAEDADITLRLHEALWPKLGAEPSLQAVFEHIEMPLVPVLSQIERNGVLVDAKPCTPTVSN